VEQAGLGSGGTTGLNAPKAFYALVGIFILTNNLWINDLLIQLREGGNPFDKFILISYNDNDYDS